MPPMNQNTRTALIVLVVLIVAAVGYVVVRARSHSKTPSVASTASPTAGSENSDQASSVTPNKVDIGDMAFVPASITVKAGTAVSWLNTDSVQHTVTADTPSDNAPASQAFGLGETYVFLFTTPGTYTYHCSIHPSMKGTVIVTQ